MLLISLAAWMDAERPKYTRDRPPSLRLLLLPTMQDLACGEDGGGAGGECKKSHDWLGIRGLVDEAVCPSGIGLLGPLDRKLVEAGRVQATCPAGWRITTHALDGTSVPQETDTMLLQDWKTSESRPSAMPMTMASFIGFLMPPVRSRRRRHALAARVHTLEGEHQGLRL